MNGKKILSNVVVLFLLLAFFVLPIEKIEAHSSTCIPGSESRGWKVFCDYGNGHAGKSLFTYKYALDLPSVYKSYTSTGATRWNNTGVTRISYYASSSNLVTSFQGPDSSYNAFVRSWVYTSTWHKSRWEMHYNRYTMASRTTAKNNATATHEFGHTIGLVDLKFESNLNKLMHSSASRTAQYPTSYDITGAREAVK